MPPTEVPPLEAVGLERAFGPLRVLRGLDLRLDRGEVLMVLGPNGAGKTTLLRTLAGLLRPSAGEVRILGRRLAPGETEARRPIGLLSHQSLLYDDLTLLENLMFTARLYGLDSPRDRARAALASLGLADRAGDPPKKLSRGMVQRAAIARAVLHEPVLLLLDEPFTGLDAGSTERLQELLQEQCGGGRSVVLVTHHPAEAWPLATRVGVLVRGRWVEQGARPDDLAGFVPRYQEMSRA
jgi:heme ABC exporter ATP-binding subunit CcmA